MPYSKTTKKKLKKFKKDIKLLKKQYKKLEFRPCQNDAELSAKENELRTIMNRIYTLEYEQDRMMLNLFRSNERD